MSKKITQILKLILFVFSMHLAFSQYQANNSKMVLYWIVVAIYWLFNYISGISKK